MIYPRGVPIHENLSSEYTDVLQLLSSLKSEGFSGSVEIVSTNSKGVFLISSGDIVEAVVSTEENPTFLVGDEAVEELNILCTQPASTFSVYELSADEMDAVASTVQSDIVFKGLSTDFVRLDRFIKKLQDEKHTGYIEVYSKDNALICVLVIKYGVTESVFAYTESDRPVFKKGKEVQTYMKELYDQSLFISVYRTTPPVFKELPKEPMKEISEKVREVPLKSIEKEREVREVSNKSPLEEKSRPVSPSDNWWEIKEAMRSDIEKAVNAVVTASGRSNFISDVQEIFRKLERFVAGISEKGGFQKVLKRVCVEKSEIYPFLDPFDGQFEYSGGILTIDNLVPFNTLCAGLADCLHQTLIYLQKEMPKVFTLPPGLKGEIESSFSGFRDILKDAGIQSIVPFS
jgi:hypothetical protein